ncbi:12876_t:CDS:2, partial [Gigaspora margarita]
GMMGCKLLEQELCIKQILLLQNQLNNDRTVLKLAHIRIKQDLFNAVLVGIKWKSKEDKKLQQLWQGNLACRVLVKAKELKASFGFNKNWWCKYRRRYPIRNLLQEEKGRKNLIRGLQDTGIFFVEQLLDQNGNRRAVKEESIGDANNMYTLRMASKKASYDNRKKEMVKDTNSLEKSSIKVFQCMEKQEEDRSSKICPIPTDMLEEMEKREGISLKIKRKKPDNVNGKKRSCNFLKKGKTVQIEKSSLRESKKFLLPALDEKTSSDEKVVEETKRSKPDYTSFTSSARFHETTTTPADVQEIADYSKESHHDDLQHYYDNP